VLLIIIIMSIDKHTFHRVDPCTYSFRLLYDFEKPTLFEEYAKSKIKIYTIKITDWKCITLGAKVDDVICIKNHIANIYRRVIL